MTRGSIAITITTRVRVEHRTEHEDEGEHEREGHENADHGAPPLQMKT